MSKAVVICKTCESQQDVVISDCLAGGWPKCCGATMSLQPTDPAKFGQAVVSLMEAGRCFQSRQANEDS